MPIAQVSVGGKVTAAKQNEIITAVNSELVVPSVSGTGVTVDSDTGVVSYTSATTVTIDGLSTDFRIFEVDYSSQGTATSVAVTLRTTAPADVATNYDYSQIVGRNAGVTQGTSVAQTSWSLVPFQNTLHQGRVTFAGLAQAIETTLLATAATHADPAVQNTANGLVQTFASHRDATAYGGFKITFIAAQTGTLRIRGIQ